MVNSNRLNSTLPSSYSTFRSLRQVLLSNSSIRSRWHRPTLRVTDTRRAACMECYMREPWGVNSFVQTTTLRLQGAFVGCTATVSVYCVTAMQTPAPLEQPPFWWPALDLVYDDSADVRTHGGCTTQRWLARITPFVTLRLLGTPRRVCSTTPLPVERREFKASGNRLNSTIPASFSSMVNLRYVKPWAQLSARAL
jgi:hypothetical protein